MNKTFKGILFGLMSGMFWGLDTSLNAFILTLAPFVNSDPLLLSSALLIAFLHDFFSAILLTGSILLKKEKWKFSTIFTSKSTYFVIIAALFAGPIGMRAYLYAVDSIGAGLTATISALYPACAAILGAIFLKDYLTKRGWLGLILVILATIILGYSHFSIVNTLLFGVLAAFLCVLGWAFESIITAYGMKDDLQPKQALLIRQWTSSIIYLSFMLVEGDVSYNLLMVLSSQTSFIIILLAIIGTFSYLCYYSSINIIGPVKATSMNVTYSVWTIIFSLFIFGGTLDIKLVVCGILITFGTLFVVKN